MIHLDANASTAIFPEVLDAMLPWLRECGANPSGNYAAARAAREAIERSREQVAGLIGAHQDEIIFTCSGTESINTALNSMHNLAGEGYALISHIEHNAVIQTAEALPRPVKYVDVDAQGRIDLDSYRSLLDGAALVSVMTANNETGVVQPVAEMAALAKERGVLFHSDAVQTIGKSALPMDIHDVTMASISGHKFHGPTGVGALYVRRGVRFFSLLKGGSQELGRRAGTENTVGIVGMGAAAEKLARNARQATADLAAMRDSFEQAIVAQISDVEINGASVARLPNTSNILFKNCHAPALISLLDQEGVSCSGGSTCMEGTNRPSHVLLAMGLSGKDCRCCVRFSFSHLNTLADAADAAALVAHAVETVRSTFNYDRVACNCK